MVLATCKVSYEVVTDLQQVTAALAERGLWAHGPVADGDLLRQEIRRACRARGIRVRTGVGPNGQVWACTADGLPAEEPWRGAAVHVAESGVMDEMAADVLERLYDSAGEGHAHP